MNPFSLRSLAFCAAFFCLLVGGMASSVRAANTFSSGSTGADGAFAPTASVTLQVPDSGVFNFTTVSIPSGVTVTFTRNLTNTPVTILASGDVTIAGAIDVSGGSGTTNINVTGPFSLDGTSRTSGGPGGPGGFDGGGGGGYSVPYNGVGGDGPGGGGATGDLTRPASGGGGGYYISGSDGTSTYGTAYNTKGGGAYGSLTLTPLIGGSGGGGGTSSNTYPAGSGGGGGGALLIASSGTISFSDTGQLLTSGGNGGNNGVNNGLSGNFAFGGGGGSGGAIRLVATGISGSVSVNLQGGAGGYGYHSSYGGSGGAGYLRVEAYNFTGFAPNLSGGVGAISTSTPSLITPTSPPLLQIVSVAGINAPALLHGSLHGPPDITVHNTVANPVTVALAAKNIPVGTLVNVSLTPQTGTETTVQSTALAGTASASTATASVSLPDGKCLIYASATIDLTGTASAKRLKMDGEPVDKILVAATFGGPSRVTYILHSGRKIVLGVSNAFPSRN